MIVVQFFRADGLHLSESTISELQEQTSIIITTNKGFEEWAEFLDDAALATAILDRLSYRCDRIQMSGKSYRLENRKSFLSKGDATDEI